MLFDEHLSDLENHLPDGAEKKEEQAERTIKKHFTL